MTPTLPSVLPCVVVASPDAKDDRMIKDILDAYVLPFHITPCGYDRFTSCSTGRSLFNLLFWHFEAGAPAPTVFVSSALEDGRGWVYTKSLVPGFYFCLMAGSAGPDEALGTTRDPIEEIEDKLGQSPSELTVSLTMLHPEQLRMLEVYRRCGKDWDKVERFLVYGTQMHVVELFHNDQPFLHTADAVYIINEKNITSRIPHLDDAILAYLYPNEAG